MNTSARFLLVLLQLTAIGWTSTGSVGRAQSTHDHNQKFANKTIVITGASSGFGRAVAIRLAAGGANVVLAARRLEVLNQVALECGQNSLVVVTDVSKAPEVQHLEEAAVERFGHIDVWINDAGIGAFGRFTDIPLSDHQRVVDTDLMGVINGSHFALRDFKKRKSGILINVASMAGKIPIAYYASYSASKCAVVGLDAALRAELKADHFNDIRVCTVNPIAANTPFWKNAVNYTGQELHPKPMYEPDIVVDTIVSLVTKPKDEVNVGLIAKAAVASHSLTPKLIERMYGKVVRKDQMKEQGKDEHAVKANDIASPIQD